MKFLLLALSLNLQILYPNLDTCEIAAAEIQSAGHTAICIPKGEDVPDTRYVKDEDSIEKLRDKIYDVEALIRTYKRIERVIDQ